MLMCLQQKALSYVVVGHALSFISTSSEQADILCALSPDPYCRCADVHTLLADIGMEQESFESAMTDHKRALELLSTILQVCLMFRVQGFCFAHLVQVCVQNRNCHPGHPDPPPSCSHLDETMNTCHKIALAGTCSFAWLHFCAAVVSQQRCLPVHLPFTVSSYSACFAPNLPPSCFPLSKTV